MRLIESKLETAGLEKRKLEDKLALNEASLIEGKATLERQIAENQRLIASLNEAKAQFHFENNRHESIREEM